MAGLVQLRTHSRTTARHPISGCNNTLASQNCSNFLRLSKNAGRNRASGAFGGRDGSAGSKCGWTSGAVIRIANQCFFIYIFLKFNQRTGNVRFNAPRSCSNAVYLFNTCIVVPSLVVITMSYTTYAPAPFPTVMLDRSAFPVAASPTVDHPEIRTF